jgi:hypothetical protein
MNPIPEISFPTAIFYDADYIKMAEKALKEYAKNFLWESYSMKHTVLWIGNEMLRDLKIKENKIIVRKIKQLMKKLKQKEFPSIEFSMKIKKALLELNKD